jgi:hypothetical protein
MHSRRASIVASTILLAAFVVALPTTVAAPAPGGAGPISNQILVTVHPLDWKTSFGTTGPTLLNGLDVSLLSVATAGEAGAGAAPDLPTSLYGRPLRLVEVQFCYDATHGGTQTDVVMTQFLMRVDRNTTGTTKTNPVAAAVDVTHRSDEACRIYPVDWVLDPGDMAAAGISVDFGTAGTFFEIGRLTFVLETTVGSA